ncbi:phytanoyl-CoA dioxygenase family protein [Janibacter cremeus]|uniref:Phytanoyl-CoA dioxygenase n=1 Tax=Janibacter cremeus TaxID=1285192 RepID=A0A852VV57_9MICO|nr:phytanoyl-CoA dioxygenase family protein [Janibacter cremeus]NYF97441.1 hypothetical protein [Janibacter cremeus]
MTLTTDHAQLTLRVQGDELSTAEPVFGEPRDSSDALTDYRELNRRMSEDGYLLLRGLLPAEQVRQARGEVTRRLAEQGLLKPNTPPEEAVGLPVEEARRQHERGGDASHYQRRIDFMPDQLARNNAPLNELLYGSTMMSFFGNFFGEPAKHFDFTWFRSTFPHSKGTRPHTDAIFMGRAEREQLFTAWTPMGDIDRRQGGLLILEGSHRHPGLRHGYSTTDVDAHCENRPEQPDWWARNRQTNGDDVAIGPDINTIQEMVGGRWLTTDYAAGDVLIFSIFTVHGSLDNQSDHIRLSSDSRYQPASKPADARWVGDNPPGHGDGGKRGLIC